MSALVLGVLALLAGLLVAGSALAEEVPEALVTTGSLRGKWLTARSGRPFAAFEGVPYAEPPVGGLRFKAPVAKEPWTGALAADKYGSVCPQKPFLKTDAAVTGNEDCLYLNVYAPKLSAPETLPVMVFIHGGGFTSGSSNLYGPEFLLDRDLVYVSFNYRLGALGFLSTGDDQVPGNMGLKDMVLALQWVRDNIHAFGGDPKNVTIFGESAGAASVHLMTLSPLARGLFGRAILMSGSALAPWSFYATPRALAKTDKLANILGCPTNSSAALRDCLVSKSAEDIVRSDHQLLQWFQHPMVPFRPTVEPSGPGAFLDKHPAEVYAEGGALDVPVLNTVTAQEGCIVAVPIVTNETLLADLDKHFLEYSSIMLFSDHLSKSLNDKQFAQLRQAYFGDKAVSNETLPALTDLFTDAFFAYSSLESAKLQVRAAKSPVYMYELGYASDRSFGRLFGATNKTGACHGDDLPLVFPLKLLKFFPAGPSEEDTSVSETVLDLMTTFAFTGAPTKDGSFPPVKDLTDKTEYAYVGGPGPVSVRRGFHNERMARWAELSVNVALALPSDVKD